MDIREKLKIIQLASGATQTELARKVGVSFAAFNSWWGGRSIPHKKKQIIIDELYLEYTGQKIISEDLLTAKKQLIAKGSSARKKIISRIVGDPDIYDQFILDLTYNSNSIEGSTLSENETAAILFNNAALADKSLVEQIEAKNHQTALTHLFTHILHKGKIDEAFILKLHGILMNGIHAGAGSYRHHGVRIVGAYVPTANYLKVPSLMKALIEQINARSTNLILRVADIHSKIEQIHPFADGNGRVGRILMNAMLLKENTAPAVIRQGKKRLYYTYLNKAQLKNDNSQLQDFICDAILEGFNILNRK